MSTAAVAVGALSQACAQPRLFPDAGPLMRFDFPTIGHVYDVNGQPLLAVAREYRRITPFADIPPVVRDAILAAEDKRFFSHNGVDFLSVPRVIAKVKVGAWMKRLLGGAAGGSIRSSAIFPQGASTITQQLVRGVFLTAQTAQERSDTLRSSGVLPRLLSPVLGARNVNMLIRKREEVRLASWIEREMRAKYGSKRRAKEEIFARYVSFVYMGHGQYGFDRAAEFYLNRRLSSLTENDADLAAMLAGIMKSPRAYAPTAAGRSSVARRRNQILALMQARGSLSAEQAAAAHDRPLPPLARRSSPPSRSSAVVEHVLHDLTAADATLGLDDLLHGRIQIHSTVDLRVQQLASEALEHGLARYEERHPRARGLVQGAVVVLRNGDGSILAEVGGRQVYRGRAASAGDFNRARQSMRQPGSAMKPLVYLAAFRHGGFDLDSIVPDNPISLPHDGAPKWIANYDGRFRGLIPLREALAESRNAVAVWITSQIGIEAVLQTSRSLGLQTPLRRYASTSLGASEVPLLDLSSAYRAIASGVLAEPHVIQRVAGEVWDPDRWNPPRRTALAADAGPLLLIQEGLRGVVRLPTGTARALNSRRFPIPVMGKTGTTNDYRDAIFIGSTYGLEGITVGIRIGFDDNRSLGAKETGGRVALPVFEELMAKVYGDGILGPVPRFPDDLERRITAYLRDVATTTLGDDLGQAGREWPWRRD